MLSTVIEIIVIAIILISGLIEIKKGFVRAILGLCSTFVTIIVAYFMATPVANWFNNNVYNLGSKFSGGIASAFIKHYPLLGESIPSGIDGATLVQSESFQEATGGMFSMLKKIVVNIIEPISAETLSNYDNVASILGLTIGNLLMIIITGIVIYFLLKIIVLILIKFFDNITDHGTLGTVDKILGFVLGAVKGLVIVVALCAVTALITLIPTVNEKVSPIIQETKVTKFIYNTTDDLLEKYVIDGEAIQNWISDLWDKKSE